MADYVIESYLQTGSLGLKNISNSLFSIPGFFVGFGNKNSSDCESLRSPTSPLDFKFFSNLSNPFSLKSPSSLSSESGHQKKWDCCEVGLGIINSLVVDEPIPTREVIDSPKRKNVLFGPQIKTKFPNSSKHIIKSFDSSVKSKSLPRNYVTITPNSDLASSNDDFGNGVPLESETVEDITSTLTESSRPSSLSIELMHYIDSSDKILSTESIASIPEIRSCPGGNLLNATKPTSLPIAIGSLSAKEIELSEDYTCIISHGPNPKTIHIFGDCILECHANELTNFGIREEAAIESPQAAKRPGEPPLCYLCKKCLEDGEAIYIDSGEKAFCSDECRSQVAFAEEEIEKSCNDSCGSSPKSSYLEDLFILGEPNIAS